MNSKSSRAISLRAYCLRRGTLILITVLALATSVTTRYCTVVQPIQLRLTKHVMYFALPYHADLRMGVVHRRWLCGKNCQ